MYFPQTDSNFTYSKQFATPVAENNSMKLDMKIIKSLVEKKSGDALESEILILRMRFPEAARQAVIQNLSSSPKPLKWVTVLCQKLFKWRLEITCYSASNIQDFWDVRIWKQHILKMIRFLKQTFILF